MKNILVVGASSGIGKSLTHLLQQAGHNVIGTYRSNELSGSQFHYLDVLEEEISLGFLPESLDGLVYCPGSINLKPFARLKPAAFEEDYKLQVIGAIKVLQAALKPLKKSDSASVVLFSTVAVQAGFNFHAQVAASKGALEGLTRALAAEFAPKIRVNCIAPSLTDTPLASKLLNSDDKKAANAQRHPLKKIGTPEDIAEMAAFLLSDKSTWISGQVMHVDGGMSNLKV
ncbi:MAG: SDR family oxidoreductase [Saprospiraceae bacterium]|nr:SDR family oxidoreductase [Saprospiraceae bacterium]